MLQSLSGSVPAGAVAGVTGSNWKKRMTFASLMEAASEGRIRGWTGIIVSAANRW